MDGAFFYPPLRFDFTPDVFPDPFDYFLLDADTGELRTAKPLDREALEDSTGVLTLTVKAREVIDGVAGNDASTVSTAEATVTIKDINDEPPSFNRREYSIEIPENVPDGTPLPHLDMTVRDPDVVSRFPSRTNSPSEGHLLRGSSVALSPIRPLLYFLHFFPTIGDVLAIVFQDEVDGTMSSLLNLRCCLECFIIYNII